MPRHRCAKEAHSTLPEHWLGAQSGFSQSDATNRVSMAFLLGMYPFFAAQGSFGGSSRAQVVAVEMRRLRSAHPYRGQQPRRVLSRDDLAPVLAHCVFLCTVRDARGRPTPSAASLIARISLWAGSSRSCPCCCCRSSYRARSHTGWPVRTDFAPHLF